jgi:solute carrier family 50 protein (sugar transporter)
MMAVIEPASIADVLADGYGSGEPIQNDCASADGALVQAFGWLGCLAAWGLFLAPMPTMREIMKVGHIGDFSPLPYLVSMLQCFLWAVYALPFITPCKTQPLITNIVGFLLELGYILIFVRFAHSRRRGIVSKSALVCLIAAVIVAAAVLVAPHIEFKSFPDVNASRSTTVLGFACSVLNVAMYGSPLGVVRTVIRTRSVRYMPLPLTIGCGLCSVIWTVYALLVMDFFIMVSEHAGCEHAGCDAAARAPYRAHPSTCSLLERRPERLP